MVARVEIKENSSVLPLFTQNLVVENISPLLPVTIFTFSVVSGNCLYWASKSWWRFTGMMFGNFVTIGVNVVMSSEIATLGFNIFKSFINWLMRNHFWGSSTNATTKFLLLFKSFSFAVGGLFLNAGFAMIFAALSPRHICFSSTWEDVSLGSRWQTHSPVHLKNCLFMKHDKSDIYTGM